MRMPHSGSGVVFLTNAAPAFGEEYEQAVSGVQRGRKFFDDPETGRCAEPELTNHAELCIIMHKVERSGEEQRK
jgi:hypothetical protein